MVYWVEELPVKACRVALKSRGRSELERAIKGWARLLSLTLVPYLVIKAVRRWSGGWSWNPFILVLLFEMFLKVEMAFWSWFWALLVWMVSPWRNGHQASVYWKSASAAGILGVGLAILCVTLVPVWIELRKAPWCRDWTICGREVLRPPRLRVRMWRALAMARGQYFVGASMTGRRSVALTKEQLVTHAWIVGGPGTGKTQSVLLPLIRSAIFSGRPVFFIDGKGDRSTANALWAMAQEAGRESDFRFFDIRRPAESCTISPLLGGTANEQCDKIMAALTWKNPFFRSASQAVLLDVLSALKATGLPFTLFDVVCAISEPRALQVLVELVPVDNQEALTTHLTKWKSVDESIRGLRDQLRTLLATDFGSLLKDASPTLSIAEAYQNSRICYFALPVARFPETAPLLAKLLIADLNAVSGLVQDDSIAFQHAAVVIDEFAAFANPLFIHLINKGRSAGMSVAISHQSMLGDLAQAGDGYASQMTDNTNVKLVLRQSEDAENVANLCGTRPVEKMTEQTQQAVLRDASTGLGSIRDAQEFNVSPNLVRQLPPGIAVVKVDQPVRVLDLVKLDFVDAASFEDYLPPPQHRNSGGGIDLRGRIRGTPRGGQNPPTGPRFSGA
jgi:hypothetical protein